MCGLLTLNLYLVNLFYGLNTASYIIISYLIFIIIFYKSYLFNLFFNVYLIIIYFLEMCILIIYLLFKDVYNYIIFIYSIIL